MKILLIGYYGKANFGDDVLFKVTYSYVRQWKPDAEIFVLCDQYKEDYLQKLVAGSISIVYPGNRDHYDIIVHGGGGTFFDFNQYGIKDRFIHRLMKTIGFKNSALIDKVLRVLLGKPRISTDNRLGWGIGVGTYSDGSKKLRDNIPVLLDFNTLVVRDTQSIQNLEKLGIKDHVVLGSDLAFLHEYWAPKHIAINTNPNKTKKLGLVIRDWKIEGKDSYLSKMSELLYQLNEEYELTVFIFDKRVDKETLMLVKDYNVALWDPISAEFDDYCMKLSEQDVIVTSRAHGAMCGAILGVPSVLIELEPKLRTIHDMLPHTTSLIKMEELDFTHLDQQIKKFLNFSNESIELDIKHNAELIRSAVLKSILEIEARLRSV